LRGAAESVPVVPLDLAPHRPTNRGGHRPRQLDRRPSVEPLHVRAAPAALEQVEVQERLPAHVEDAWRLLDHGRPGPHERDDGGDVAEQLGRAVRHRGVCYARRQTIAKLIGRPR
jgi:hypothetical protein